MSVAVRFLSGSSADAALSADIRTLSSWSPAAVAGALDVAHAFLSSVGEDSVQSLLEAVASAHGLKIGAARRVLRSLTIAVGGAVKQGLSGDALGADLKLLGASRVHTSCARVRACAPSAARPSLNDPFLYFPAGLDDARAAQIADFFDARRDALTQLAADRAVEGGVLLDADWRFGVTVSTDDIGRVGSTFFQLRLLVDGTAGAPGAKEHFFELTVAQFYSLLSSLEKAQTLMTVGAE
jgi:hypothetical protein